MGLGYQEFVGSHFTEDAYGKRQGLGGPEADTICSSS